MKVKLFIFALAVMVTTVGPFGVTSPQAVEAKPTTVECPDNWKNRPLIERGSTGRYVRSFQRNWNTVRDQSKTALVVDGVFGEKTEKAVKNFQRTHTVTINGRVEQLRVDGVVGPKTWCGLYQAITS